VSGPVKPVPGKRDSYAKGSTVKQWWARIVKNKWQRVNHIKIKSQSNT